MNKQVNVKEITTTSLSVYSNTLELMRQTKETIKLAFIGGLMVGATVVFTAMVILK